MEHSDLDARVRRDRGTFCRPGLGDTHQCFSGCFLTVVGSKLCGCKGSLDADYDFVGVFGVFGEVSIEEMEGVGMRFAIKLAPVPEVGSRLQGCLHGCESLLIWDRSVTPCEI